MTSKLSFDSSLINCCRICTKIPVLSDVINFIPVLSDVINFIPVSQILTQIQTLESTEHNCQNLQKSVSCSRMNIIQRFSSEIKGLTLQEMLILKRFLCSYHAYFRDYREKWLG